MMFSIIDDMDRRERDYSIDFVKGVAILFVILLHNMPNESIYSIAYIGQAVPLFLLVSSYLTYGGFQRKGFNGYFSARNVKKMLDRVSLPFFLLIFLPEYHSFSFHIQTFLNVQSFIFLKVE